MPAVIEALARFAAELLSRAVEAEKARTLLEERLAIRQARVRADKAAREKFGL
jgi:hypothetical protein